MSENIGLPIKADRTVIPTTKLVFLGLELDSELMEIRLPLDKLLVSKFNYLFFESKESNTKGVTIADRAFKFCMFSGTARRTFLRRIIYLTKGIQQPHHKRRLTKETKADLLAWSIFRDNFNGKGLIFESQFETSRSLHMYPDASQIDFGGVLRKQWFAHK
jgi:hypothetical protein